MLAITRHDSSSAVTDKRLVFGPRLVMCVHHSFCLHCAVASVAPETLATKVWRRLRGGGRLQLPTKQPLILTPSLLKKYKSCFLLQD
jgi:hypothetical protein